MTAGNAGSVPDPTSSGTQPYTPPDTDGDCTTCRVLADTLAPANSTDALYEDFYRTVHGTSESGPSGTAENATPPVVSGSSAWPADYADYSQADYDLDQRDEQ